VADPDTYRINNTHSFANLTIRHVAYGTTGIFSDVTDKLIIDSTNLASSSIMTKINVLSVNSSHAKRDERIKKEEYLDAAKFNQMTFVSTKVTASNSSASATTEGILSGNLIMHGVTK
jgi:polyisoprenoid-binding protein YceI